MSLADDEGPGSGVTSEGFAFCFGLGRGRGRVTSDMLRRNDAWESFQVTDVILKSRVQLEPMTSTPPVIFKRTKAKTALRTRDSSPGNDTETSGTTTGVDSPSILATKLKNKVKKKTKSRLSFGGDEDEVSVCNAH